MSRIAERLAEVLRSWREGRCEHCLRPVATDADWETIPEGEGEHLCWDYPTCHVSQSDPIDAHVQALLPVVEREIAAARGEAWLEGHAAGRDYQGDGWNSDVHDPARDNPYRAALGPDPDRGEGEA